MSVINRVGTNLISYIGLFMGGTTGSPSNVIDYVSLVSLGNALDFGDLSVSRGSISACSSATRGVCAGGYDGSSTNYNTIDYVDFINKGNASDFGDLSATKRNCAACSSATRGLIGGGYTTTYINVIDYITIASPGNASDFGDLTVSRTTAGCSNCHGGL